MRGKILLSTLAASLLATASAIAADSRTDGDPLQIVVSINEQSLKVYRGTEVVASSNISSGKPGHATPTGIFSILHKKKFHRSNQYSNSPMPWMQRLTWTGIALHESDSVPAHPASHGCVRLPGGFAEQLFGETSVGEHVIISGDPVVPEALESATLPQPAAARSYDPLRDQWMVLFETRGRLGRYVPSMISTAALLYPVRAEIAFDRKPEGSPIRILITRQSRQDITAGIQRLLNRLGYEAGPVDGLAGKATFAAVRKFQADHGMTPNGVMSPEFAKALYKAAGESEPATGHIHVRRDFEPLFDAPISIDDPEQPLGTHLITASNFDPLTRTTAWVALTLENQLPEFTRAFFNIAPDAPHDVAAGDALARVRIPDPVMQRLSRLLTPGSSVAISDEGVSGYSAWKSDFVVITRTGRPA